MRLKKILTLLLVMVFFVQGVPSFATDEADSCLAARSAAGLLSIGISRYFVENELISIQEIIQSQFDRGIIDLQKEIAPFLRVYDVNGTILDLRDACLHEIKDNGNIIYYLSAIMQTADGDRRYCSVYFFNKGQRMADLSKKFRSHIGLENAANAAYAEEKGLWISKDAPRKMPPKLKYDIGYPIKFLSKGKKVESEDNEAFKTRLQRNMYYRHANEARRTLITERIRTAAKVADAVVEYLRKRYPQYEVLSVSLYGSYLYADKPHDIDLRIIVKGNCFFEEEISLDNISPGLDEELENFPEISFIAIGEENIEKGIPVESSITRNTSVTEVMESDIAIGYLRNVVLLGYDFIDNRDGNVIVQVSNLLSNTYRRLYGDVQENYDAYSRRVASRLCDVALYLKDLYPKTELDCDTFIEFRCLVETGEAGFVEITEMWDFLNTEFQKIVSERSKGRVETRLVHESELAQAV